MIYSLKRVNPTSDNNREIIHPNSYDQTGYGDQDKDCNYMPAHISIAPCSVTNNKQIQESNRGQTQTINDRQTLGMNEQSQHAIEMGELQLNQVQRAQVDNRLDSSAQLGGETCIICHRSDHATIACPIAHNPSWCFKCGKLDHQTFNCLSRDSSRMNGNNEQSPPTK